MISIPNEQLTDNISEFFSEASEQVGNAALSHFLRIPKKTIVNAINKKSISPIELMAAGFKGNFAFETFLYRKPDSKCLVDTILGRKEIIPDKYKQGAFSTRLVSKNILKSVRHMFGESFMHDSLMIMQTSPDVFAKQNLHKMISTEFNSDLLAILKKEKRDIDLGQIGVLAGLQYSNSILSKSLHGLKTKDIFAKLGEEIFNFIEKSHDYKLIDLSNSFAVFEKRLTDRVKDSLKVNKYSNNETCSYLVKAISVIPTLGGNKAAKGYETKCSFVDGSDCCQYVFEF